MNASLAAAGVALLGTLAAAGCRKDAGAPAPSPAPSSVGVPPVAAQPAAPSFETPLSQKQLPTTSAEIALGNLDGEIATVSKILDDKPDNAAAMAQLAVLLLEHGRIHGRIAEYERADTLVERAVKQDPKLAIAWRAHAKTRSRLHRFDEALEDLKRYSALGGPDAVEEAERMRGSILQAQGRYSEARSIVEKWARAWPRLETLGQLAALDADEGRIDQATREFAEAQKKFANVSPFPVVWLYFQEGLMWQSQGRFARARELFEAAHERLPPDAAVTSHLAAALAATGEKARAVELLRPLAAQSDDPEYVAQLAQLDLDEGRADEAKAERQRAAARFDELVAHHPAAFADHAARFWLGVGGDANKALSLARRNLEARKTADAFELATTAALAAGDSSYGCETAEKALATLARPSAHFHVLASRAFDACGKKDRAGAELRAAESIK